MAQDSQAQRVLAFGTWLPPEPALRMDHAVDALRESGEGFLLNLTTSNGHAFEAMGRAVGGHFHQRNVAASKALAHRVAQAKEEGRRGRTRASCTRVRMIPCFAGGYFFESDGG